MYIGSPSRISSGSSENLDNIVTPNSSPRRSARLNPPPTAEKGDLETPRDGSLAFASQHDFSSLTGGSPSRRTRSSTRYTASTWSKEAEAGRATKTSPGQVPRGREMDVPRAKFSKKRKRDESEDNEEERNHGPRIKRARRDSITVENDPTSTPIELHSHIPALQHGLVNLGNQGSRSPCDTFDTLSFTWEADFDSNSLESLSALYEEVCRAQQLHEGNRVRGDSACVVGYAHTRLRTAQTKWNNKALELVLEGQYFLLNEVFNSLDPISFGLD
ncbi:hypothetical protein FRB91_010440 [Serendipita sp. 411]|nr:hypothetical protein FRB91_010440 [Serendipita sp. 411]